MIMCFSWEGNALFGNAHYSIGEKIVAKIGRSLSEVERLAFLSGMVYADIGRLKFDKLCGVESDSRDFLKILKANAITDQEKWFAKGVQVHILQDEMTSEFMIDFANAKITDYTSYILRCSLIDYYFFKISGRYIFSDFLEIFDLNEVSELIECKKLCDTFQFTEGQVEEICKSTLKSYYGSVEKISLSACDDLLIRTYQDLGLNITKEDLHRQQANMLGAFILITFIVWDKQEIFSSLAKIIEEKSEKIADVCSEHIKNEQ